MTTRRSPPNLPVDPARLWAQFPALTSADLDVYTEVTARILGTSDPAGRARLTREIVETGRAAESKAAAGAALDADEDLALRYVRAIAKMQGRTS